MTATAVDALGNPVDEDAEPSGASTAPPKARAARGPNKKATKEKLSAIHAKLSEQFVVAGTLMLPALPVTGTTFVNRSDAFATHLCALGEANPKVLRVLERFVETSVWAEVAMMGGTILIAVGVDRGLLPDSSIPAQLVAPEIGHVREMQRAVAAQAPQVAA